ncbi:MAG TPA: hypothetical protein DEQ73_03470 [Phycisphaerales bacterium]|jgi:integral membrane protein|nr:MAG: DUF3817 domain-containing protein [Phycisphaera sp. TMED24]HCD29643.1 hypothetical protein [Phycisphaerales bacterium]|tara:strand:- start:68 stop:367 length:300 start_codon:yes stop_codon:yes gene_type:complete
MVSLLRRFSLVEGISTLVLFLIAMPLKYVLGYPMAVTYVGWVHGVLFVGLWLMFLLVAGWRKIPFLLALVGMLAAIFPFGPFLIDGRLRKYDCSDSPKA